jgi:hypothetical protein
MVGSNAFLGDRGTMYDLDPIAGQLYPGGGTLVIDIDKVWARAARGGTGPGRQLFHCMVLRK